MRIFLRILAITGALLALLLLAVAIALWRIDVNDFRGPIQAYVKDKTGRDMAIRGAMELKLSLEPKLVLNDVTLANAPWSKTAQMLSAKRVEARLALLPLLHRRFEIGEFALVEPVVVLETDRNGVGNWEFHGTGETTPAAGKHATASSGLDAVSIADLSVSQGAVTYLDGKSGKTTRIVVDRFVVHARNPGSPVAAEFRGRVDDVSIALEGELGPLEALQERRWPYPVGVKGEIDGQTTAISTKLAVTDQATTLTDLDLKLGPNRLTGKMSVSTAGSRRQISATLHADTFSLEAARAPTGAPPTAQRKPATPSSTVFSSEPVNVRALSTVDADIDLTIGQLLIAPARHLDAVHVHMTTAERRVNVQVVDASGLGGSVHGRIDIDTGQATSALTVKLDAKALELSALLALANVKRETRGGKTDIAVNLALRGESPRQWASSATGSIVATVGKASLVNGKAQAESSLDQLGEAINPFRGVRASTELECAVIRLPFHDGVAKIDQGIAMETKEVGVSASGSIDLRSETLDLSLKPRIKRGIPIDITQMAELVRFRGPLREPKVSIDAVASAATLARLGVAVQTGGLSILGEALLSGAKDHGASVCAVALGRAEAGSAPEAKSKPSESRSASPLDAIGRVLGKIR